MLHWFKILCGLFLLPVCLGTTFALWQVLQVGVRADTVIVAFLAGAGCWLVIFALLPKPMWVYVVGHELTHALWAWLFGGRVKKFKATSQGGHVVVTKTNFLITLAPYFFPLYAILVVLVFVVGQWFWNWQPYRPFFHLLLGAAYAFHLTLTVYILRTEQTDITSQGAFFSAIIIWLGNVLVLLIGLPLLTGESSPAQALQWAATATWDILRHLAQMLS